MFPNKMSRNILSDNHAMRYITMLAVMPKTVIKAMNLLLALENTDLEMNILHPHKKRRMSMGNEIESSDSILDSVTNS